MNLSQLLTRIARGPVGDLAVGGDSSGVIPFDSVPKMVDAAQATLTKLHTRFPLQLKLLTIATVDGLFDYPLRPEFAQSSDSTEVNKFIVDSEANPFTGDMLAIEHILDASDVELPLNDRRDPMSWFTSSYDVLRCGYPVTGDTYFVQYRGDHAPLTLTLVAEPEGPETITYSSATMNQKIWLPAALENAFMSGIAYEVFCTQASDNALTKAQMFMQNYEQACAALEFKNTVNDSIIEDRADVIRAGGWI